MKAIIKTLVFDKEVETKNGVMYKYNVTYNEKKASFLIKTKDEHQFKINEENEFTEEAREYNGNTYYNIKPIKQAYSGGSNYGRAIKKEQSKYSGFAVSYVKDLIIADKIKIEQWESASKKIFNFMVELDKSIES